MKYELYADSLFLVNFVMNLYLLLLVNRSLLCAAAPGRLMLGAALGALSYFLPFFMPGPPWLKQLFGMGLGTGAMIWAAFRVRSLQGFLKILEKLLIYSFFLGGALLFLIRSIPVIRRELTGILGIMGMGAVCCLLLSHFLKGRERKSSICRVTLIRGTSRVTVSALLDSGNSLAEPISGKPVSIIEKSLFQSLWKEEQQGFRAVPYHSIGKKRGILRGYLLPELQIEADGEVKSCREVYVAVSEELCSSAEGPVKMILHPALMQGRGPERVNGGKYDIKGSHTWKNPV